MKSTQPSRPMTLPAAWPPFLWAALACLALTAGCTFKGAAATAKGKAQEQPVWQVAPVRLRVYPSSRITVRENTAMVEARVELFDAAGDSTKGVGAYYFELYRKSPAGDEPSGPRLYSWEVPVLTLAENQQHYDSVTQSYLFRLKLKDPALLYQDVVLQVSFQMAAGAHLEAQAPLMAQRPAARK